ncbi:M15 family metallopeptidase, partial [Fluviibacterium sp. DFM31]
SRGGYNSTAAVATVKVAAAPAGSDPQVNGLAAQTLISGQSISGAELVSVSDPDGISDIVKVRFWDSTPGIDGGYWEVGGLVQSQAYHDVSLDNLSAISYVAGPNSGSNQIFAEAFDASGADSNDLSITINVTSGSITDTVAKSKATLATLVAGQTITGTIDQYDADGSTIDADYYQVTLTGGNRYTFSADAGVGANDTLDQVFVRLRDSNGNILTLDKFSEGTNPNIIFDAPGAGNVTYYVSIGAGGGGQWATKTGNFSLSLVDNGQSPPTISTSTKKWSDIVANDFYSPSGINPEYKYLGNSFLDSSFFQRTTTPIETRNINHTNFSLTGYSKALESFQDVVDEIYADFPTLAQSLSLEGAGGMFVNRKVAGSQIWSNHSWGIAVDIGILGQGLDFPGIGDGYTPTAAASIGGRTSEQWGETFRGIAAVIPYFNKAGWIAGAGWDIEDSMHFEISKQLISSWNSASISMQADQHQILIAQADQELLAINGNQEIKNDVYISANGQSVVVSDGHSGNLIAQATDFSEISYTGGDQVDDVFVGSLNGTTILNSTVFLDGGNGDDNFDTRSSERRIVASGDNGDDLIRGGSQDDILSGGNGSDLLFGHGGNDWLDGSSANDTLFGGSGDDTLLGGASTDILYGDGGADALDGGEESDVYFIDAFDTVTDSGLTGYDKAQIYDAAGISVSLNGWSGIERINGYSGKDQIDASSATDSLLLFGGGNDDTLTGGLGSDVLIGGDGDDALVGNDGNDTMLGAAGNDTFDGGAGNDVFYIGESGDLVSDGGAGFDKAVIYDANGLTLNVGSWLGVERINGLTGDDIIDATGMATSVTLVGSAGNDLLTGGSAGDVFFGGGDDDVILGAGGADALIGAVGNDWLNGGAGKDFYLGGAGADSFAWSNGFGRDVVKDYTDGLDRLDFSGHSGVNAISDLAINQSGTNTLLSLVAGGPDQITLVDTLATSITNSDFDFV